MDKNITDFISNTFLSYYPVSESSLSLLHSIATIKQLKKNETLLSFGQISKESHILYKGIVVSNFLSDEGNTYHKNIFLEGNFLGSTVSALKSEPSNFSLEIIENATIISFDYLKYRTLIEENEDLKNFYVAYLEKNWIIIKEQREIDIVMKDAKTRYLNFINLHPEIEKRVPLHYIASHLGITPTQLSRIRKNT
ncbi:Crp/Fnr family transcriptional regulator [Flavobacterium sp.]|uniref:Crp/Fnr family transcriptional regulator n=1 Tax=Flavobacterium sp. TaxID=239 RepID=UPI0040487760